MTKACNITFYVLVFTVAGTSGCATGTANPAEGTTDAAPQTVPTVDTPPVNDAVLPTLDASGGDATANPVCSAGDQPCATGCCPIAPPDPLAAWTIGPIGAIGTCHSSSVEPYSCYPSTPGRDANGCCIANFNGGTTTSTLNFRIDVLPDGRHELTTTACSLGVRGQATEAICEMTATATEPVINAPLRNPNAPMKSTNYYPYYGPLSGSIVDGILTISYNGVATDFASRCGAPTRYKTCTWTAP